MKIFLLRLPLELLFVLRKREKKKSYGLGNNCIHIPTSVLLIGIWIESRGSSLKHRVSWLHQAATFCFGLIKHNHLTADFSLLCWSWLKGIDSPQSFPRHLTTRRTIFPLVLKVELLPCCEADFHMIQDFDVCYLLCFGPPTVIVDNVLECVQMQLSARCCTSLPP